MGRLSDRYQTPVGAIGFLTLCFTAVLSLYGSGLLSITTLIKFPNATFILTYIGGCAAGIRLLRGSRAGVTISWISFAATLAVFPFTGWAIMYPLLITLLFVLVDYLRQGRKRAGNIPVASDAEKISRRAL